MRKQKIWNVAAGLLIGVLTASFFYGCKTDIKDTAIYVPNEKAIRL